jgi:hypothetical protein
VPKAFRDYQSNVIDEEINITLVLQEREIIFQVSIEDIYNLVLFMVNLGYN